MILKRFFNKYSILGIILLFTLSLNNCFGSSSSHKKVSTTSSSDIIAPSTTLNSKAITSFSILNRTGVISGTNIGITLPFGTNVTSLVAKFSTNGVSVKVGSTTQVSSSTPNNFTNPVTYVVQAQDGTTQNYTVIVAVASNTAKDMTAFSILGKAGIIIGSNIGVTLPYGTSLTSLVATFNTNGASVTVGGTPQTSGTTSNNFSSPITYVVHASDGSTSNYSVTVAIASDSSKDITAYSIMGIAANIMGRSISLIVPNGTDVSSLVADFSTNGSAVNVGSYSQVSGSSVNDFSTVLTYVVHAQDGTTQDYRVSVTVASNSAKDMNAFSILGNAGVISGTNIGVTLPFGTAVTSLVATFVTNGSSTTVLSTNQISGNTANNFSSPVTYVVHV